MAAPQWDQLGAVAPRSLTDARLQLHWAAQVAAAVGHTFGTPRPDDSQSSFEWQSARRILVGQPVGPAPPVRAALRPSDLTLLLADVSGAQLAASRLAGMTLDQTYAWMERALAKEAQGLPGSSLERRDYEMPAHDVADGGAFGAPDPAFEELGRWYSMAATLLAQLRAEGPNVSPVRCWPHHFDIGVLLAIDPESTPNARSIGVGLSPGDGSYSEPYWYVNLWPVPERAEFPPLDLGHWHADGWRGAVLTGTELVAGARDGGAQAQATRAFLQSAIEAARTVLGKDHL